MITQTYTISTIKQSTPPIVKMSQYDHGSRTITFSVVDGSGQAVVLTGKTVRVEGTRLDGHAFAEDCTVSGSTASFTDTSDMTNAPGAHPAELVIESDGDRLGTMNFVISVETAAMDENADITEEDVSLFEQLLGSIEDATGAVEAEKTAALSAIDDDKDAALLAIAQGLASGSPLVVDAVADMTDQTAVYLYSGSESGYTAGNYYFYNGSAWVSGGTYGNPTVDAAFSNSSVNPVQNKVVSAAVSELKSDLVNADFFYGYTLENGYISTDGSIASPTSAKEKYTSLIEIPYSGNIGYALSFSQVRAMWLCYALYDENETFISRTTLVSSDVISVNSILLLSTTAKYIRFTFRSFDDYVFSLYNPLAATIENTLKNTDAINAEIGTYNKTFGVTQATSHKATNDQLNVPIKSGEVFHVIVNSTCITGAQIYVYYTDLTDERIYSGNDLNQYFIAQKDIGKIGLYIASSFVASTGDVNINVIKYGSNLILNNINSNYCANIRSVNHRGFYVAPENTIPAYKMSRKEGFTHVETDVLWTSDDVPVLLHDSSINRTARNNDGTAIDDTVYIANITYAQALTYDFGVYKGAQFAGTRIPTFTEFIVLCKKLGLKPYVELKGGSQEQITGLVNIVKRYDMVDEVTWISFYTSFLEHVQTTCPSARVGYIVDTITAEKITEALTLKNNANDVFIDTNYSHVTTEIIESCVTAGVPLEVYTLDDITTLVALDAYISGVTSNKLLASKVLYDNLLS